jgi:hypothetical protein
MDKTDIVPMGLQHHSIVGVDNYPEYDGLYKNDTDAKALSVGLAQWKHEDEDGIKEISAKVFRHNGKRWSRQSEELPLHRCFDLCILIVQALQRSTKGEFFETGENCFNTYVLNEKELEQIKRFYDKYKEEYLEEKMRNLKDLLERFLKQ